MAPRDGWAGGAGEAAHWFLSVHLDSSSSAVRPLLMLLTGPESSTPVPGSHPLSLGPRELQKDKRERQVCLLRAAMLLAFQTRLLNGMCF